MSLPVTSGRASHRTFFAVSAVLFTAAAASTIAWSTSISPMGGMPMPGGWTMSMMWMRMPGQTWLGVAATFVVMWIVMMAAMMLPSLIPMLWRYRQIVGGTVASLDGLTTVAGAGYFVVWTAFGLAALPLGIALATVEMRQPMLARAVPLAGGVVVALAGALQFTAWKARHLACCRSESALGGVFTSDVRSAWRYGVRLGIHCGQCCAGLMAVLLVTGMMNVSMMAVLTTAITAERCAPSGERIARAIGVVLMLTGAVIVGRALVATPN